jgi:hypothetical protein
MERLVLHPTPESQWVALVQDARQLSSVTLSEDLESYLVFLLMRFTKNSDITQDILALDFLNNINKLNKESEQALREVGDKCLLFSGLFPRRARRRRVHISYYVKLGQSAYSSLSEFHHNQLSQLFAKLGNQFVGLMDVLQTIRSLDKNYQVLDLLEAYELWSETKSAQALKILRAHRQGIPLLTPLHSSQRH